MRESRVETVEQINKKAIQKKLSAERRDKWLYKACQEDYLVLSDEQEKAVNCFWEPYRFAITNDPREQAFFSNISGRFDESYFGFGLQRYLLTPFWNSKVFSVVRQKNYTPLFFHDIKMAKTILFKAENEYFTGNRELLPSSEAVSYLINEINRLNCDEAVIKPSDGGEGKSIKFISKEMNSTQVRDLINEYCDVDFICEELVTGHQSFEAPYSGSLNTLRMNTLNWKDKIYFCGAVLRMGTRKRVDNWSQGGLACGIKPDGKMSKYAFYEDGTITDRHPVTGFVFENHEIFRFGDCVDTVIRLHKQLPQQKYISWDITVNKAGEIMLIELNSPGSHEMIQMAGYNGFYNKEIAKEIFDEYLIKRFFYEKAIYEWNYREFVDHISLREYCGDDEEVFIPTNIDGKSVRLVYLDAFHNTTVKKVYVPASVSCNHDALRNKIEKIEVVYIDKV